MGSNGVDDTSSDIRREIESLQKAKLEIEDRISALQARLNSHTAENGSNDTNSSEPVEMPFDGQLSADMIYRYSRQLLLPLFGVEAQANLLKSSVLVIGAGGLGSPALLYLAACGIGACNLMIYN